VVAYGLLSSDGAILRAWPFYLESSNVTPFSIWLSVSLAACGELSQKYAAMEMMRRPTLQRRVFCDRDNSRATLPQHAAAIFTMHAPFLPRRFTAALALSLLLAACSSRSAEPWHLTDVSGHLPNLNFSLTDDGGAHVTGRDFAGKTTLLYFGYTHCPDVCPETMARLMQVLQRIGPDADKTRIVFVSVDPARDTPALLRSYVRAFDDKHAVGLTGSDRAIEAVAQRYRVAYQMEKRDPNGEYEVTHSSAVYVFDAQGHARLLATDHDSVDAIAADLKRVIDAKES
jgi:protein SCO1